MQSVQFVREEMAGWMIGVCIGMLGGTQGIRKVEDGSDYDGEKGNGMQERGSMGDDERKWSRGTTYLLPARSLAKWKKSTLDPLTPYL
jgi:hypothetical protein